MKYLFTTFLLIIASMHAYSSITGNWKLDWEEFHAADCTPSGLTINEVSENVVSITYSYASLQVCENNSTGNYTSNLTLNTTTNSYVDSNGDQLTYDSDNDILSFTAAYSGQSFLSDRNGSIFDRILTLSSIGGTWINSMFINSTVESNLCCVPDSFYIYPEDQSYQDSLIYVNSTFSNSCAAQTTSDDFGENMNANTQYLNWTVINEVLEAYVYIIYNPETSPDQMTVQFSYFEGTKILHTCTYSFSKVNEVNFINGTWKLDWQSQQWDDSDFIPASYQIETINNSYMLSIQNYTDGSSYTSFVLPQGQNQYYDAHLNQNFTYDETTNTLFTISSTFAASPQLLYSQNGSYINDNMFGSTWSNAQSTNATPLASTCCVPQKLYVIPSPYTNGTYDVTYTLPSDYKSILGCQDIADQVFYDQLEGTLQTSTPSLTSLNWTDSFGSQYSFANSSDSSSTPDIIITNFANLGCDFQMAWTSSTPSFPSIPSSPSSTLSSNWMLVQLNSLFVFALIMLWA